MTDRAILCRRFLTTLLFAFAAAPAIAAPAIAAPPAEAVALQKVLIDSIAKAEKSVVSIARIKTPRMVDRRTFEPFGRPPLIRNQQRNPASPEFIPNDFGAGIIIASPDRFGDPLVLTNYHVVQGGPAVGRKTSEYKLYLRFPNRRGCYAEIFAADPRSDLAVLKIDFDELGIPADDLVPIEFANSNRLRKGRLVIALGNPYAIARDGSASASWGMISNIARRPASFEIVEDPDELKDESVHHLGTLLQVDARLEFGTSGGALVDLEGNLLGITTALAAIDGYEKSAGYAIPIDESVQRIIRTLSRGLEVEYGFLGVTPRTLLADELRKRYTLRPASSTVALAASIIPGSPANGGTGETGLKSGDIILAIGEKPLDESAAEGTPILDKNDLMREIALLPPGTMAHLLVWRESAGRKLNCRVKLGKWPPYDDEGIIATNHRQTPWRGLSVDYSTARRRFMQYPPRYPRAVAVMETAPGSSAAKAGLQPGDFITHVERTPVETPAEFHRAVADIVGDATLTVLDKGKIVVPE